MTKKLTLRLDDAVIKKAKKTARTKGVSLSSMVEDYFRSIAGLEGLKSSVLYKISGVLSGKRGVAEQHAGYRKHLAEKYW